MPITDFKIPDIAPREQYVATAGQVNFPIPFRFFKDEDIEVYFDADPTPVDPNLYTLTGAGTNDVGDLALDTGADEDTVVTIARNSAIERLVNFINSGDWQAKNVNDQLNRVVTYIQEVKLKAVDLAMTLPITSLLSGIEIPDNGASENADRVFAWNPTGDQLINGPTITNILAAEALLEDIGDVAQEVEDDAAAAEAARVAAVAAAAGIAAIAGKVYISNNDTTPNYLLNKLTAGAAIQLNEQNNGANENIQVRVEINTNTNFTGANDLVNAYFLMNYASNHWHIQHGAILDGINLLTQETAPAMSTDFVHMYKTGTGGRKATPNNLNNMVLLASGTAAAVANVVFNNFVDSSKYNKYILEIDNVTAVANDVECRLEASFNNGGAWQTSYRYVGSTTSSYWNMLSALGNQATSQGGFQIEIREQLAGGARYPWVQWRSMGLTNAGVMGGVSNSGVVLAVGTIDALRFSFHSGNIATLSYKIYGVKK